MPTAIENLSKDSSPDEINKAISSCIATEVDSGREQKQAVAMCYSMARKKTGRTQLLSPK